MWSVKELKEKFGVQAEYLAFDFTKSGQDATDFYTRLDEKCTQKRYKNLIYRFYLMR